MLISWQCCLLFLEDTLQLTITSTVFQYLNKHTFTHSWDQCRYCARWSCIPRWIWRPKWMTYIWETVSVPHFPLYTSKWTAVGLNKLSMINPTVSFEAISTNLKLTLLCYVYWVERQCQAGEQNRHSYEAILEHSWQLIVFEGLYFSSYLQATTVSLICRTVPILNF